MRYYIIAGEASGDLHGANLMKGLYAEDPDACIRFWGGDLMGEVYERFENTPCLVLEEQTLGDAAKGNITGITSPGGTGSGRAEIPLIGGAGGYEGIALPYSGGLVRHYKEGAVMGFTDVLAKAGRLLGNVRFCKKDILAWKPDVVILIDYPGFNFKIAEFAHKHGFRTFYYIAPKVWASREGRIRKLKKYVDKLFIVLPFEIPYFTAKGVDFIYKGNPLVDAVDGSRAMNESRTDFLERNGLEDKPYIALLAGSRKGEISTMMPVLTEFAAKMNALPQYAGYQFIIAGAPARTIEDYAPYLSSEGSMRHSCEGRNLPCAAPVKVLFGETQSIIRHAEAAVVNSGTASLETVLLGTPQAVGYIMGSSLTYRIAKKIVKIKYISLGNLVVNRLAFKEFIQDDCTADNLVTEIRSLIEDGAYRSRMLDEYAEIRNALGGSGASRAVAREMVELLGRF